MRRGWRSGAFALGCTLAVALAGCGAIAGQDWSKPKGGAKGEATATGGVARNAGPPPGGWPQPENGQITETMCGLLTDADYAKFGHRRLPSVSAKRSTTSPNRVDCIYMTYDALTLDLQPTAESAKLVFASEYNAHKRRMAEDERQSILATSVVQGADASWYDFSTLGTDSSPYKEHELQLRRGSLLVGITLSGLRGKTEQDPRTVLTGLAALVLQRIPDVGKTDTGHTRRVTFEVTGTGRATTLGYNDPTSGKSINLKNVALPWRRVVPMGEAGQQEIVLNLNAASTTPLASIGCRISVDGVTAVEQPRSSGFTSCLTNYRPKAT